MNAYKMNIVQILRYIPVSMLLVALSVQELSLYGFKEKDILYIVTIVGLIGFKTLLHFLDNVLIKILDETTSFFFEVGGLIKNKIRKKLKQII